MKIEVNTYEKVAALATNDAASADPKTANRVLALAARMTTNGRPSCTGFFETYISTFMAAVGHENSALTVTIPAGNKSLFRWHIDAAKYTCDAAHRGTDVGEWDVTLHENEGESAWMAKA